MILLVVSGNFLSFFIFCLNIFILLNIKFLSLNFMPRLFNSIEILILCHLNASTSIFGISLLQNIIDHKKCHVLSFASHIDDAICCLLSG